MFDEKLPRLCLISLAVKKNVTVCIWTIFIWKFLMSKCSEIKTLLLLSKNTDNTFQSCQDYAKILGTDLNIE